MKRLIHLMVLLFVLAPVGAYSMYHGAEKRADVKVAEKEGIGSYLTDAEGRTLYWFKRDSPGTSACAGACLERWPVFYRQSITVTEGVDAGDFGTLTRDDGAMQTSFRGYPLYYWAGDTSPGDTSGHGVNEVWFVVDPGNFPPR